MRAPRGGSMKRGRKSVRADQSNIAFLVPSGPLFTARQVNAQDQII